MWRHIVLEGYCFANIERLSEKPPCGRQAVSTFCLLNGMCPHFSYCDSSEREAALFAPLWAIIRDRIKYGAEEFYWKLRWYFWGRWFFEKEWGKFKEYMKTHRVECPAWDEQLKQAKANFPEWFRQAQQKEQEEKGGKEDAHSNH